MTVFRRHLWEASAGLDKGLKQPVGLGSQGGGLILPCVCGGDPDIHSSCTATSQIHRGG